MLSRLLTIVYHCFLQPRRSDHPAQLLHKETLTHACRLSLSIQQPAHPPTISNIKKTATTTKRQTMKKKRKKKIRLQTKKTRIKHESTFFILRVTLYILSACFASISQIGGERKTQKMKMEEGVHVCLIFVHQGETTHSQTIIR